MNVFVAVKRDDGGMCIIHCLLRFVKRSLDVDIITPHLDGTILPGVTRESCLALSQAHTAGKITLPGLPPNLHLYTHERTLVMLELVDWSADGKLLEVFGVGTAVIVAPVGRIGFREKDLVLPKYDAGLGPIGQGLWTMITNIQTGKVPFEDWSVPCV